MNELKKKLLSSFDNVEINIPEDNRMIVITKKESVLSILSYLKKMGYNHFALESCNDWIDDNEFELIYILSAYLEKDEQYQDKGKRNIILKTRISREKAKFITIIDIFENAEPYEREIHEMFGIYFEGHPRLTPLLLERDYDIPPFRKDFDTNKYVENTFGKIPSIKERKKEKNERT
jgi:NADH-quinone oxidoreductase subunit C